MTGSGWSLALCWNAAFWSQTSVATMTETQTVRAIFPLTRSIESVCFFEIRTWS